MNLLRIPPLLQKNNSRLQRMNCEDHSREKCRVMQERQIADAASGFAGGLCAVDLKIVTALGSQQVEGINDVMNVLQVGSARGPRRK